MAQVKGAGHVVSSSERSCDTLVNGIRVEDCLMQILTHNAMCLIAQASPTLCDPMDCSPPGLSVHGDSPGRNIGVGCHAPPHPTPARGSSQPRDGTQVSCIAGRLLSEPPEEPKNTGVGSLSLLQGIFPTQESNQSLLHCRWILYQLSYQGSPIQNANKVLIRC